MRIVPIYLWNHTPNLANTDGLTIRSDNALLAKISEERQRQLRQSRHHTRLVLDKLALGSRVVIIEGISGSGKDTFQTYLKRKLTDRTVYDYSEGEALSSWKHFQIDGIFKLRLKFMQLFVNHMSGIISRDDKAVFLLNRFHLSTYAWTLIQDQKLGRDYDGIVKSLRTLPVHIFVLHLDDNEIAMRSQHPERSDAWRKFQQQIVKNYNFCDRMELQQKLMLEAAERHQIPYSVVKLYPHDHQTEDGLIIPSEAPTIPTARTNSGNTGGSRRKRNVS